MKYDYINIRKKDNLHKIVWACAYKHTSSKNEKHFYCKPIKGTLKVKDIISLTTN